MKSHGVKVCVSGVSMSQEQGEVLWKLKDQLQAQLTLPQLKQLLEANRQRIPSGESKV